MTAPFANKSPQPTSATVKTNDPPRANVRIAPLEIATAHDALPELYHDSSFWGMAATQFLGAFNDNLFKQLVLLLSISAIGLLGVPALAAA